MMKRKIANRSIAIAIASIVFTIPFTNAVSAMEKSINSKNYNVLENKKESEDLTTLIEELKVEFAGVEDVDIDALIKELKSTEFESLTTEEMKKIECERSVASAALKKASAWIVKNSGQVVSILKKAGIDVTSKQVQFAAKAMIAYNDTVENAVYKFVRSIAHPSRTNAQCRTGAKLICLVLPF